MYCSRRVYSDNKQQNLSKDLLKEKNRKGSLTKHLIYYFG